MAVFSFENMNRLEGADWAVGGMSFLSQVMQNIGQYKQAKTNLKTAQINAKRQFETVEYNIATQRLDFEEGQAERRSQFVMSGLPSQSFSDVERSNVLKFERDVKAMREQTRTSMFDSLNQASSARYTAKKQSIRGMGWTAAGIFGAAMTGDARYFQYAAGIGNNIGKALG